MKVLFTADIHIKLGQKNVPVDWAKNRYRLLWKEFESLQKDCDLFVIGGDVFDKLPNMEELEVYFQLISKCKIPTIIYPGNHEALRKNTSFMTNLKEVTNNLNNKVTIVDDFYSVDNMDFIPYNKLKEYTPQDIDFHGDICFTHVRGEIPPHVKAEVNLGIFDRWKVVLAGDLHSYENCQRNILYPGSPVTTSFHRNPEDTGVIVLDTDTLEHNFIKLNLPQLIRKTVKVDDPKMPTKFDHTIYEVEGSLDELSALEDSELIDKKVTKRDTDVALILDSSMSLTQEVREYLEFILELPEPTIENVLKVFHDYESKIEH
jgi:DNA repair exonuclease SbcCD nuclease subunit